MNYVSKVMAGEISPPNIASALGAVIRKLDINAQIIEIDYTGVEAFFNPAGQIQGGMLSAMLDDVTAMLVSALVSEGQHCATLGLNVSFLKPGRVGQINGKASVTRKGKEVYHVRGELSQGGNAIATATAICMAVDSRR